MPIIHNIIVISRQTNFTSMYICRMYGANEFKLINMINN
jgi:hypothetical protein